METILSRILFDKIAKSLELEFNSKSEKIKTVELDGSIVFITDSHSIETVSEAYKEYELYTSINDRYDIKSHVNQKISKIFNDNSVTALTFLSVLLIAKEISSIHDNVTYLCLWSVNLLLSNDNIEEILYLVELRVPQSNISALSVIAKSEFKAHEWINKVTKYEMYSRYIPTIQAIKFYK